ncbi:MAG: DNA primase [Muribaculaceae bacterium]|nr:DNA primase [Muribaculaceae bacterium]
MYKIDNETVRKIIDTADIVEVVSDFVSLKRRGANYIGLCPFHNERTPSFSVSKSKGICKCFSCGKGGSPVNFIMLHEQMNYQEALRYLAKKYNIEIKEHEMSDKERLEESERESLFAVNEFALLHFCNNLKETKQGHDVGLAYFRERGINDAMIEKFKLGYALDSRDEFLQSARNKGYKDDNLITTGLIGKTDRGELYDRFRGRVIYPVFKVSGKVVAFGGRTLRTDKVGGKYVNSPESIIYSKSNELYGLYQAKPAIVKNDKCILVEGYMDVISMFQKGIENVVASSGTSLTDGQVRLIHRFTSNITVIYDSDAAGIKASLRGIDMLLAEGLDVKVLSLPDGEDPDSFAQSHTSTEVEEYIKNHEVDFIKFKTDILLKGTENDPIQRAKVISDIVVSISVIPDPIKRDIYIKECSIRLNVDDRVLGNEVLKCIEKLRTEDYKKMLAERAKVKATEGEIISEKAQPTATSEPVETKSEAKENESAPTAYQVEAPLPVIETPSVNLEPYERQVIRYVLKYGMVPIEYPAEEANDADPEASVYRTIDFINDELSVDGITFTNQKYGMLFAMALGVSTGFYEDLKQFEQKALDQRAQMWQDGETEIAKTATTSEEIEKRRKKLYEQCDAFYAKAVSDFEANYIERTLSSSPDDLARNLTLELTSDKYVLSRIHTRFSQLEDDKDNLYRLLPRAINELRNAILHDKILKLSDKINNIYRQNPENIDSISELMKELMNMKQLESRFAKIIGERVVMPSTRRHR